jgi:hypothetical protein
LSERRARLVDAVELGDLDELLRIIDALCDAREWELLVELRDRSRRALERGRQLWPAASHAEYRLALDAPAEYAATMLVDGTGRFAIGPLAEVAASTHTWAELAPHVGPGPVAGIAAHERVVRGERVDPHSVPSAGVLAVPLRLEPWEPDYLVATYRADRVEAPGPDVPRGRPLPAAAGAELIDDPEVRDAVRDLVRAWTAGSEGRARVVAVEGQDAAVAAVAALGHTHVRAAALDSGEALRVLAWAGASGGAHGRRRGAAAGRDLAWAVIRAVLGLDPDDAPLQPAVQRLRWIAWNAPDAHTGWVLRVAVEDADAGLGWAVDALDPA